MDAPAYRTMTQIATDAIKEMIITGAYPRGTRLIPQKLEAELSLGRAAIREALRELQGQGLVVSVPNKGAIVASAIDPIEVREVFKIRYELEGSVCEQAVMKISETEIAKLERLNSDMAGYSEEPQQYMLLNRKFHLDFYRASQLDFLCQIIGQIYDRFLGWRSVNSFHSQEIARLVKSHQELLEAARARDGKKARKIVIEHLRMGYQSFLEGIDS